MFGQTHMFQLSSYGSPSCCGQHNVQDINGELCRVQCGQVLEVLSWSCQPPTALVLGYHGVPVKYRGITLWGIAPLINHGSAGGSADSVPRVPAVGWRTNGLHRQKARRQKCRAKGQQLEYSASESAQIHANALEVASPNPSCAILSPWKSWPTEPNMADFR